MALDPNLKDNLTLLGNDQGPRYLMPLLALLAGAVVAVIIYYAIPARQQRTKAAADGAAEKPAVSAKVEQRLLGAIKGMIASNNIVSARQHCYDFLQNVTNPAAVNEVENILGEINLNLLLSPATMTEKTEYLVQAGDSLEKIARNHGTTIELIQKCNSLQGKLIHPGDRLRIFNAKLAIIISKSRNNLLLKANNRYFKRYPVGTGKFGITPAGTFEIADKIVEPPWWRPDGRMIPFGDKDNVLGTRWLSLTAAGQTPKMRGYGIHGTWEPETIGKQASAGCVRLLNADVEELYAIVPLGTPVTIVE